MKDLNSQLERIFLELLPKSMPVIEDPKYYLVRGGTEFRFTCLVNVPYREDENDGGFKVKFAQSFKISDSDSDFIIKCFRSVSSEIALCSCFSRNGAQYIGV